MATEPDDFLGEIRLGRQLSTVWQVAAGGLVICFALAFMIPGRVVGLIGSHSPAATMLMLLIVIFTILNILELRAGSSAHGGTYTLIHETLGGFLGFQAGWVILAGSLALAASFIQSAAIQLTLIALVPENTATLLAFGLLLGLVLLQIFRLIPRRTWLGPSLTAILIIIIVFLVDVFIQNDLHVGRASVEFGSDTFLRAAAWLFVVYGAVEAVMASRRQVRDVRRRLPVSLLATVLIGGLALVAFEFFTAALPEPTSDIASALGEASRLPVWLVQGATIVTLGLAANASLVMAARQLNALCRQGALPPALGWLRPPFRVQPVLFSIVLLVVTPLLLWIRAGTLLDMAAGFFLISALLLNLAALISRRTEPNRRRTLQVAFYPLVPAIAIAFCVAMWIAIPGSGLLGNAIWITLGFLLYLSYCRTHLIEAQEGVLVFRRSPGREKGEGDFRILVPLSAGVERHLMLSLATALARQTDGEVIPLQVIPITDPLAIAEGRRIASERNTLFQWSTRIAAKSGVQTFPITRLARSIPEGILETADEEECDLILLSWAVRSEQQGVRMGRVLDPVVRRAPCDVAVVALHSDRMTAMAARAGSRPSDQSKEKDLADGPVRLRINNILVPTSGGPHAPLAARLAMLLAREFGASTSVVYVADPDASEEQLAQGQTWIEKTIATMRDQVSGFSSVAGADMDFDQLPLVSRVVKAESVVEGISQAGSESDLVFIGASEESLIDQVLFGTIPELVARSCPSPVLMVKRFRGLRRFWLQRVWDALFGAVPTLERQEQVEVYREVRRGARPDVDFFIMIGLSAVIATFGLLQDSTAVIIGAMLVAPLFTPILAFSLAIVQGDVRLLSLAVEAAIKGIALAIGLSILLTTISPLRVVTLEILSRTQPNLFDLAVALASGAAGAYAVARKDVATSLPGVAIAAALVPPLGVVGVGLAMGEPSVAWGGGLLFFTNLIAITLAGSVTLLLLGFRPSPRARREGRLQRGIIASFVLLIAITIPLASVFIDSVEESRMRQTIDRVVKQELQVEADYELESLEFEIGEAQVVDVAVTIHSHTDVESEFLEELQGRLEKALDRRVHLQLVRIPVESFELPAE